jgi:hypothetical protein
MPGDALVALAQFAGQTVATAAITDAWETVRDRFARLLGRRDTRKTEVVERWLVRTRIQLTAAAPGAELERVREAAAARWADRIADLLDEYPDIETELRATAEEVASQLPRVVSSAGHSVAAGRDVKIAASGGGIAAGAIHGNVVLTGPVQDERLRSMQVDTYVAMLRYKGGGMLEDPPETATAEEWAVRGELMAKAEAFASGEAWELWQKSALAHAVFSDYVSEEWPQWHVGAYDVEAEMEKDPEFQRLRQAMKEASKQLRQRIQAELGGQAGQ